MKLLIADDEVQIRTGIEQGIDWSMFEIDQVYIAANGIEAWEMYNRYHPDIVITDIRMPGMDGLELSRKIKQKVPTTPIILLSGYADFQYAKEAIQIGVSDYELKPVKLRSLIEMVRAAQSKLIEQRMQVRDHQNLQATRFLEKLILGERKSISEIESGISRYLGSTDGSFVCVVMEWDGLQDKFSSLIPEIREQIHTEVRLQIASWMKDTEHLIAEIEDQQYFVLCRLVQVHSMDNWEALTRQWHWTLNNTLVEKSGMTISLGMSPFGSAKEIMRVIDEARDTLHNKRGVSRLSKEQLEGGSEAQRMISSPPYEYMQEYEADILDRDKQVCELKQQEKGSKHPYLIKQAIDYIKNNYRDELTVDVLAEVTGITPNYFSHLFNKEVGVTFREYLNRLRIGEAKRLLKNSSLLAYEITNRVGFLNYKYFCQVFKKSEGCSPSDYRKKT
jgi:YesN/AraC family two-component response regulator